MPKFQPRSVNEMDVTYSRAEPDPVDLVGAGDAPISQYVGAGDAEADAFADAVTGALGEVEVPTTFALMIVDTGKSLIQMQEERTRLDFDLMTDLRNIDAEAAKRKDDAIQAYRRFVADVDGRLLGVAKAMGA